jgi:hypothetical protein
MLSPDLDPDNYDNWTDVSYMECLRFNFERNWNQKKIVLEELGVRKRLRNNLLIQFRETPWGTFFRMPELFIPESYFARQFQRRFRLPYLLFLQLVEDAKEFNILIHIQLV